MSVRYLLTCPDCQQQVPVETGRAGGIVSCACGKSLDVPTMRGLRELPREEAPVTTEKGRPAELSSSWGPKQGTLFLGFLFLLIGGLPLVYLFVTYPEPPFRTPDQIRDLAELSFDRMTLTESWQVWKNIIEEQGLTQKLTYREAQYAEDVAQQKQWLMIFGFVTGAGFLLLLGGIFMRP